MSDSTSNRPLFTPSVEVPDHLRVDPGTAIAEWIKQLEPEAPVPVFSTRALDFGKEAYGAQFIKHGLGFNGQMDLLWATGFPKVAFIVDGFPQEQSKKALVEFYQAAEKQFWWQGQLNVTGEIYTRRGAYARVFELLASRDAEVKSVLNMTEEEFLEATEPRDISDEELVAMIKRSNAGVVFKEDMFLFEALVGPKRLAQVACNLLGDIDIEEQHDLALAFLPLGRRLPVALREEVGAVLVEKAADEGDDFLEQIVQFFVASDEAAKGELANGEELGAMYRVALDGWEAQTFIERKDAEPFPIARDYFTGDVAHIAPLDASGYDEAGDDKVDIYLRDASGCCHPAVLGPLLKISTEKLRGPIAKAWLTAHGTLLKPHLEALAAGDDKRLAKLAAQQLKKG